MTWIAVIVLALLAFAIAAFLFKLDKGLWTSLAAALGFGLAGYALQASPDMPAAPKSAQERFADLDYDVVEARREFVDSADWSQNRLLVTSDAMARLGRFEEAAQFLAGETDQDRRDFEVWLAQGIALVEHADGALTQASLYAFQQAANAKPDSLAPGYFLGVALIRQGRLMEARQIWRETLAAGPEDAAGREGLEERLVRLDGMLGAMSQGAPPIETEEPAAE